MKKPPAPSTTYLIAMLFVWVSPSSAQQESLAFGKAELEHRGERIVTYRAWIQSDYLVVEARHEEPWHTYAMDNQERARARTGAEVPDTELPTRIEISRGLARRGEWLQSEPLDLSRPEIGWHTWGFEGTTYFALPVALRAGASVSLVINGQACTTESCAMIDDLELSLDLETPAGGVPPVDVTALVPTPSRAQPSLDRE